MTQRFSTGGLAPQGTFGHISGRRGWQGSDAGIGWVEVRAAGEHAVVHRHPPEAQGDPAPDVSGGRAPDALTADDTRYQTLAGRPPVGPPHRAHSSCRAPTGGPLLPSRVHRLCISTAFSEPAPLGRQTETVALPENSSKVRVGRAIRRQRELRISDSRGNYCSPGCTFILRFRVLFFFPGHLVGTCSLSWPASKCPASGNHARPSPGDPSSRLRPGGLPRPDSLPAPPPREGHVT